MICPRFYAIDALRAAKRPIWPCLGLVLDIAIQKLVYTRWTTKRKPPVDYKRTWTIEHIAIAYFFPGSFCCIRWVIWLTDDIIIHTNDPDLCIICSQTWRCHSLATMAMAMALLPHYSDCPSAWRWRGSQGFHFDLWYNTTGRDSNPFWRPGWKVVSRHTSEHPLAVAIHWLFSQFFIEET